MSRRLTAIASATPRSSDSMPGIRGWGVDEHDDRPAEFLGEPHRAHGLAIALGPRVAEVAENLLLRVFALHMPDDQHRLPFVVGQAGHQRMVVGVAPVAVNLDEAAEEPLDEVLEAGTVRMPRHQDPLPRRQRLVEIPAHRLETPLQRLDLAIARIGLRQLVERVDLLEDDSDRLFEVECLRRHLSQLH